LTRARTVVDPADAAVREQLNRNVQAIMPKEILQVRPQL
jgi:hypothetical protein